MEFTESPEGYLEVKQPCPHCGSSDAAHLSTTGIWKCFSCSKAWASDALQEAGEVPDVAPVARPRAGGMAKVQVSSRPVVSRKITEATSKKFGYFYDEDNKFHIATYRVGGKPVAQHLRGRHKKFLWAGDASSVELWGQHLWGSGGKRLVITEGELDALSVSQVNNNSWPVVSLPTGAADAKNAVARNLEWVCTFEQVVLFFDNDVPGQEAAVEVAAMLPAGLAAIATMADFKDANEALMADEVKAIKVAIWDAKPYRPDGLVTVSDVIDEALTDPVIGLPWWDDRLNELTYGRRYGAVYGFGAGTGVGKTDWFTQQMAYDIGTLNLKIGVLALEQKPSETLVRLVGKQHGTMYHVPGGRDGEAKERLRDGMLKVSPNLLMYDAWGSAEWPRVESVIRHMAHGEGVKVFYLDHLTALADNTKERESLEGIMKSMAMLATELQVAIHFVSHLATPEGTPHEEGGHVSIRHFKGSRAIGYWSHFMFGLERDTQAADKSVSNHLLLRVLKDRFTGRAAGLAVSYGFAADQGLLVPMATPIETDDKPMEF